MNHYQKQARLKAIKARQEKDRQIKEWADACADEIIEMRRDRAKPSVSPDQLPF